MVGHDTKCITYREFCDSLVADHPGTRLPLCGSFEITARCNLKCQPCYIRESPDDSKALKEELSYREAVRILDEVADEGCLSLTLTGGEPTRRSDFEAIYLHAKRNGMFLSLLTNGTRITPRIADLLAEWPPRSVEITLYGRTDKVYEAVTQVPGSYAKCMRGIELLLERDLPLSLKSTIITTNKHEVQDMKRFAAELGVDYRFDAEINPRINGDKAPLAFRISVEESLALDLADEDRMNGMREFVRHHYGPPPETELLYICGAGRGSFHIDSRGLLSICLTARQFAYDLKTGTFREGWLTFIPRVLEQRRNKPSPCRKCDIVDLCNCCPGWARLEAGDEESSVEHLCRLAHMRAEALGLPPR